MKYTFIGLFILFFGSVFGQDAKFAIEGTYQGFNIYVQNPVGPCGPLDTCSCTTKVLVNGTEAKDINFSYAYEINLSIYGFKIGDSVTIDIFHVKDCQPKVLSAHHGRRNLLEFSEVKIDSIGILHWQTKNELVKVPYTIQVFRWNKWVTMGEVDGKGSADGNVASYQNTYEFKLVSHAGENKIRIKQDTNMSSVIVWNSNQPEVNCNIDFPAKKIVFSSETSYEIYDSSGNIVKRGRGKEIDYKTLKYGDYFLNYDNKSQKIKFVKPKKSKASK